MKIRYKIGLFVAVLVFIAYGATELAVHFAKQYVVYREFVDLNDEALARGRELQEDVRAFRDDVLRLAFAGLAEADPDGRRAARAIREMQEERRARGVHNGDCVLAFVASVGPDGTLSPPTAVEGSDPDGLLAQDLAARKAFLKDLGGRHEGEVALSDVATVMLSRGDDPAARDSAPILWAGAPVAESPPGGNAESDGTFVIAALDLRPRMKWLDESARHLSFVITDDRRAVLLRPDHGADRGLAADGGRMSLADGALFEPVDDDTSILQDVLGRMQEQRRRLQEQLDAPGIDGTLRTVLLKEIEELDRRGKLFEYADGDGDGGAKVRYELGDRAGLWYQQWQKWEDLAEQPVTAFNVRLEEIVRGSTDKSLRWSRLSPDIGRVRVRTADEQGLTELRGRIDEAARETLGRRPVWEPPIRMKTPVLHVSRMQYDPFDARHALWLIQAVTIEEIEGETLAEMKWARMLQWSSLAALAVAFVFSFNLTRTLERLTNVARRLRTDARTGGWEQDVARLSSVLATSRSDELGVLSNSFGHMIEEVHRTHEQLREERNMLDRRVAERTNELQASNDELVVARDKAEAAKRATDAFVASVSHELRTPLNHIIGFCQLMELTDLDDQQRDDLGKIRGAGQYLLDLINDILDYQKIIMGVLRLETEDIALAPLVDEISDAMRMKAAENGNEVVVDCGPNLAVIHNDPKRLRQILNNLIGNACKFTRKGTITVSARRYEEPADGRDWVEISIRDTGVGMTPEQQSKLFQPFAKLSEKQGNKDGTGLGLVITRGFCERMGGGIAFESEAGKGTAFHVRFPAVVDTESRVSESGLFRPPPPRKAPPAEPVSSASVGPAEARAEHHVLVIDDDPNVQEMMRRFLEARGFRVIAASSGEEGLRLAKQHKPAVITLDALMPDMDGWETLAALKTNEVTARIPVIMVTMVEDRSRGYALGVSDFLVKPVDWDQLEAALRKYDGVASDAEVLVVDDDADHRSLVRRQLEGAGYRVVEAANGRAALDRLAESRPRLILLDLMMPVMDGFEFVEELRRDPQLSTVPVVVVTAKDADADDLDRLNGGVVSVLQKGACGMTDLLQLIHDRILTSTARPAAKT